jgi:hypothetical protein
MNYVYSYTRKSCRVVELQSYGVTQVMEVSVSRNITRNMASASCLKCMLRIGLVNIRIWTKCMVFIAL